MIDVKIENEKVKQVLQDLQRAVHDPAPALREIGEVLEESTKQRFVTTTDPDGHPWLLNSVLSTLHYKESDRPLTGETGKLMDEIHYQLIGSDTLQVGSPMKYAAMQQFGGTKAEFPNLWGDILARPFLGISESDEAKILSTIERHLIGGWD